MLHNLLIRENTIPRVFMSEAMFKNDRNVATSTELKYTNQFISAIQLENELYLTQHPEIKAMLKTCLSRIMHSKTNNVLKEMALYFTKPSQDLDKDIKEALNTFGDISPKEFYQTGNGKLSFNLQSPNMHESIAKIIKQYHPNPMKVSSSKNSTPLTVSSSFISILTSESTVAVLDEPKPICEPTTSEIFYTMIVNVIEKATYSRITHEDILYDTAYVELMKAVEAAMEIPVREIREDIATLIDLAYRIFDNYVKQKEKQAAALAFEKRMRKKLKKTLRRQNNFKGYETPPTPKSEISSHESYKVPPPAPCICHPQWTYNRYPKDRFGIYLPRDTKFVNKNITTTPVLSVEDLTGCEKDTMSSNCSSTHISKRC